MRAAIIYGTQSKILRRIFIPDSEEQLREALTGPGESLLVVEMEDVRSVTAAKAAIERATGVAPQSGRCVVLDGRDVVERVIFADPAIDSIPNRRVIAHPSAREGDTVR